MIIKNPTPQPFPCHQKSLPHKSDNTPLTFPLKTSLCVSSLLVTLTLPSLLLSVSLLPTNNSPHAYSQLLYFLTSFPFSLFSDFHHHPFQMEQQSQWTLKHLEIHQDISTQLCTALHQLRMHEFLTDLDQYLRKTAKEDLFPAIENLEINNEEEWQFRMIERTAAWELLIKWGETEVPHNHPWYFEACFSCHHLRYFCVNCYLY